MNCHCFFGGAMVRGINVVSDDTIRHMCKQTVLHTSITVIGSTDLTENVKLSHIFTMFITKKNGEFPAFGPPSHSCQSNRCFASSQDFKKFLLSFFVPLTQQMITFLCDQRIKRNVVYFFGLFNGILPVLTSDFFPRKTQSWFHHALDLCVMQKSLIMPEALSAAAVSTTSEVSIN